MGRRLVFPLLLAVIAWYAPGLIGGDAKKDFEKFAEQEYKGKIFAVRFRPRPLLALPPWESSVRRLEFDKQSHLKKAPQPPPSLPMIQVMLKRPKLKNNRLEVDATAVCFLNDTKAPNGRRMVQGSTVPIRVDLPQPFDAEAADRTLQQVFLDPSEAEKATPSVGELLALTGEPVPEQPAKSGSPEGNDPTEFLGEAVYRVKPPVQPPSCASCIRPNYSEAARAAKAEGLVVLWGMLDETGKMGNLRMVKSLGCGLDQAAVQAVQKWKFKPALREGRPVPVFMAIEIRFNLYR